MVKRSNLKREERIEELLKKNVSTRRAILSDIPDVSQRGSPLDKVTQKDNIDIERLRKKRHL